MTIVLIAAGCSATTPDEPPTQIGTDRQPTTKQTEPVAEPSLSSVSEPPERPADAWSVHTLDRRAPESDSYSIAGEGGIVIVVSARNGQVAVRRTDGSGESVPIPDATSPGHLALLNGTLTMVSDRGAANPIVWQSANGTRWNRLTEVAWALPGEQVSVGTMHAVGNRLLAGGAVDYMSDLEDEGPRSVPAVWTSSDGATWFQSEIEVVGPFGRVSSIAEVDGTLLAVGSMGGRGAMWRSIDDGRTWARHEVVVDGPPAGDRVISELAVLGNVIVGVGESTTEVSLQLTANRDPMIIWSPDSGLTWTQAQLDLSIAYGLDEAIDSVVAAGGALWAATGRNFDSSQEEADRCYLDLEGCRAGRSFEPMLLRSVDGRAWVEVEIRDFDPSIGLQIAELVDVGGGVAIVDSLDQLVVYSWESVDAPPEREPLNLAVLDIPIVRSGSNLEVGVTYRYPLSSYCGIEILGDFNATFWSLSSGDEYVDETWPWVGPDQVIYGYMTLVDEITINFHPTQDPNLRPNVYNPVGAVTQMCN